MQIIDYLSGLQEDDPKTHLFEKLLSSHDSFCTILTTAYICYFRNAGLLVDIDKGRLLEAFAMWKTDLERVKVFELPESDELDQFKQSAHLVYWLRRLSPIISIQEAELDSTPAEVAEQELLFKYGNQYCAFDLGFRICAYFDANSVDSKSYLEDYELDNDFKTASSHFLKTKNVSPHALYLIYKSLFFNVIR